MLAAKLCPQWDAQLKKLLELPRKREDTDPASQHDWKHSKCDDSHISSHGHVKIAHPGALPSRAYLHSGDDEGEESGPSASVRSKES